MTLRRQTKEQIDRLIQQGAQPRVPRSGIGLILPDAAAGGRRRKVLVNQTGVTAAGEYFYQQTGTEAPSKFDFAQTPERAGRSLMIKLLDGSKRAVSRFDNVAKQFKPTALGKKFYANRKDRYTVLLNATARFAMLVSRGLLCMLTVSAPSRLVWAKISCTFVVV